MTYYIFIENGKINGAGQARVLNDEETLTPITSFEVSEDVYNAFVEEPEKYMWNGSNVVENPNYEQEQAQKEAERIAMLNLTGADVERGIYKAKGMDFDDIIAYLEAQPLTEDGQPVVDIKALKIELKANNFYRGNPYVEQIGKILGFSDEQLNAFFEDGNYEHLL